VSDGDRNHIEADVEGEWAAGSDRPRSFGERPPLTSADDEGWAPYGVLAALAAVALCTSVVGGYLVMRHFTPGGGVVRAANAASIESTTTTVAALMSGSDPDGAHRDAFALTPDPSVVGTSDPAGLGGTVGPEGPAGADGTAGADGAAGADGVEGPQGSVGATGPAGIGLTMLDAPSGGMAVVSPDGTSYRLIVTNDGIILQGPTTTQFWSETSLFATATPEVVR
jgi:hypothetical protein